MNPFNPNNPNPNNANPNNPNANNPNFFSSPAYTPTMDPSWGSPPFTFSGFQQSPNAFNQMSQLQQLQEYQALQQFMQRNSVQLDQFQSQPPTSQPQPSVELDDDDEVVPESPPKELKRKKKTYSHKKNVSAYYARAEDFRIMRLDLDSVPKDEREVYRRMKEEVKKKWTS
ncbi:hypothetical protein HanRHA438_Chr01g0041561 [Helianthus annuus]|nr:hypothetical protein HanRHA438_Chr01g0041561 [Helianthus annuus]